MNFINSFLLWSAAGAALPVLIHMLNREKPKKVNIPTVEFIIKAVQKSSGARKLNKLLLLFLRMMILLCISLIIARPQIEKFLAEDTQDPIQAVIIVDNSYYTVHKNTRGSTIDLIKAKAKDIVNALPSGTMISLMSAEESNYEFTEIKDYIKEKIDQLSPAPLNSQIRSQVSSANEILKDFGDKGRKRIYIISDMNRGSWDSNYTFPEIPSDIIYLAPIPPRTGNIYIETVEVKGSGFSKSQRIFQRRESEIIIKIGGDRLLSGTRVKLKIDNKEVDEKVILEEEKAISLVFNASFDKSGTYFCEAVLDTKDSIEIDNVFYFNIKVQAPLKVFIANDAKSLNPLIYRAALSPSGWHGRQKFEVEQLSYSSMQTRLQEEKPDLILLCGSMSMNSAQWTVLQNYLNDGGRVILSPDSHTRLAELNKNIFVITKSKIKPVEKKVLLSPAANDNWKSILDLPALYEVSSSHFFTYEDEAQADTVETALRFNDGSPSLAIHSINDGKFAFWGIPPELQFSDFINNDSFALLWHTLIEKLTEEENIQKNLFCGVPAEVFAEHDEVKDYKIQSPAGNIDILGGFSKSKRQVLKSSYEQTFIPGHYFCNSKSFKGFSCNLERSEALFQFPDETEYQNLINEKEEDKSQNILKSTFGPEGLLTVLIVLTLIFMVLEIHIGNRNYHAGN